LSGEKQMTSVKFLFFTTKLHFFWQFFKKKIPFLLKSGMAIRKRHELKARASRGFCSIALPFRAGVLNEELSNFEGFSPFFLFF
jgi:hypothetical protein